MTRPRRAITLSLNEIDRVALAQLAQQFGMMWGDKPNISKLIEKIARRELLVTPNNDWDSERIRALQTAIETLVDAGKPDLAGIVAQILLDRSELNIPLRTELTAKYIDSQIPSWRQKIDELIYQHRPFRLTYRDAAERPFTFTVLYGKIRSIEKREYLTCQCVESEGNNDVLGLQHNWFLRLDRIQNAVVVPTSEKWEKGLESIPVELHLTGGLAFAYGRKENDLEVTDLEIDRPTKRVVRNIDSTFWFLREILPYGADCEVVAPASVRERAKKAVASMLANYDRM
jgi:hypothetical protein